MNWDAIGAIGSILGAIAVVATLFYLARQIRQQNIIAADTSRTNRVIGIRELNAHMVGDPKLRETWNKTIGPNYRRLHEDIAETLDVSFDEASIIITQGITWAYTHWAQYRSMKTPEDEKELTNIVRGWYGENPSLALVRHQGFRAYLDPDFVSWLDKTLDTVD